MAYAAPIPIHVVCAFCAFHKRPCNCSERVLTDHERRIEYARMAAADGCEASVRELEELLEEGPEPDDLVPLSKMRSAIDAYLSMIDKGNRTFAREQLRGLDAPQVLKR